MSEQKKLPIIAMDHVAKLYDETGVDALKDVSLEIYPGEFVFVVGRSGSGKSTFIKLLLKELDPTDGKLYIAGRLVNQLNRKQVPQYRRNIGTIFQDFRLLENKTVFENVAFAQRIIGRTKKEIQHNVMTVLKIVGLEDKAQHFPDDLSGGEQQRVAIARALVNQPPILLADEPTGNLDPETAHGIISLLQEVNKMGTTVVVVTHNSDIVNAMQKRVIVLDNGNIIRDEKGGYSNAGI